MDRSNEVHIVEPADNDERYEVDRQQRGIGSGFWLDEGLLGAGFGAFVLLDENWGEDLLFSKLLLVFLPTKSPLFLLSQLFSDLLSHFPLSSAFIFSLSPLILLSDHPLLYLFSLLLLYLLSFCFLLLPFFILLSLSFLLLLVFSFLFFLNSLLFCCFSCKLIST